MAKTSGLWVALESEYVKINIWAAISKFATSSMDFTIF